ncbi:MAG: branched-chain amino acid ABC transporter permease [Vallitaleaceae bacterium]|nr:branched-chain amino acid ABC transporter permease [Vallitaleaceae bacterium]
MKKILRNYLLNFLAVAISFVVLVLLLNSGSINGYMEGVIVFAIINIIAAISLNIATGYLGQMALGHAGFMALGAYSAGLFVKAIELPGVLGIVSALIIGGLTAGLFGLVIGIPALRLRGDYLGIVTLGFGEIIRYTIINLPKITGGASGLKKIPKMVGIYEVSIVFILVVTFVFLFVRSRHGRAIISIRENEIAAESIGIPTTFYKVYGFFISAFIAGMAGSLFAMYQSYLTPDKFKFMFSVELFIIVVFGGMGSITGTIVSGAFLAYMAEKLYDYDELRLLIYAVLLIVLMIFKPDGLLGRHEFSLVKTPERLKALYQKARQFVKQRTKKGAI